MSAPVANPDNQDVEVEGNVTDDGGEGYNMISLEPNAFNSQKYGTVKEYLPQQGQDSITLNGMLIQEQDKEGNLIPSRFKTQIYRPDFFDASDSIAQQGYTVGFQHVPSGRVVSFKAFIDTFNESYNSDWNAETVFGRSDPIYMFKQTTRQISLAIKVPASTTSEAYENLVRVQTLVQMLYPSYDSFDNASTLTSSPLIRLSVMNIARSTPGPDSAGATYKPNSENIAGLKTIDFKKSPRAGLLGAISNLAVNHNIDNPDIGVIGPGNGTLLPKMIELNLTFNVIHEHTIGWTNKRYNKSNGEQTQEVGPITPNFPYDVKSDKRQNMNVMANNTNFSGSMANNQATISQNNNVLNKARDEAIKTDQARIAEENRYSGVFGDLRRTLDTTTGKQRRAARQLGRQVDRHLNQSSRGLENVARAARSEEGMYVPSSYGNYDGSLRMVNSNSPYTAGAEETMLQNETDLNTLING